MQDLVWGRSRLFAAGPDGEEFTAMCCNTKQKIARALRQLMSERPLSKITVQDLMEGAQMKRQSFYYHFQDIYDVLGWICEKQLGQPLREEPELDFEEWCMRLVALMEEDRAFYRRVFLAGNPEIVREFCEGLVRPRVGRLLFQEEDLRQLPRRQGFVVDFCTRALTSYFVELCTARKSADRGEVRECLRGLLEVLRPAEEACLQSQAG